MVLILVSLFVLTFATNVNSQEPSRLVYAQVLSRHGARVPPFPIPVTADMWEPFGGPQDITPRGALQGQALGAWIRENYIVEQQLLPQTFNSSTLYVRASSQEGGRVLMSAQAMLSTIYPQGFVPFYAPLDSRDEVILFPSSNCDSFAVEVPSIVARQDEELGEMYAELIANLSAITGMPFLPATSFFFILTDNLEMEKANNFPSIPSVEAQRRLIEGVFLQTWDEQSREEPNDPRINRGIELARDLIQNMQGAVDGTHSYKMHLYVTHGHPLVYLWRSLFGDVPMRWFYSADTLSIELREAPDGTLFVQGRITYFKEETGLEFASDVLPLRCPDLQESCSVSSFLAYMNLRNPEPLPSTGCCYITQGFRDLGCDDYDNPNVLDIPACARFRYHCPEVACGPDRIMESGSLLCREVK